MTVAVAYLHLQFARTPSSIYEKALLEMRRRKKLSALSEVEILDGFETSTPIDGTSRIGLVYEPECDTFRLFRAAGQESCGVERVSIGSGILRANCHERSHLAARILTEFLKDARLRNDQANRSRYALTLADKAIADHPDIFRERLDIFAEV